MKHEEIYKWKTGKEPYGLDNNGIIQYYKSYLVFLKELVDRELKNP